MILCAFKSSMFQHEAGLHLNPENPTLEGLRVAMEAAHNECSYVRLNAIPSLLIGIERTTLCKQFSRTDSEGAPRIDYSTGVALMC